MRVKSLWPTGGTGFRIRNRILEALVAVCLAFLVWLYTRSRDQESLDQVPISVQIQLAPQYAGNYDLEVNGSTRVAVSFTGPPSRIRELRRKMQRGLVQVAITLSVPEDRQAESSYRDSVRIRAADVPVPPGVMVVVADEGATIPYTVRRLVERLLPVRLDYVGETALSKIQIEPATVMVRGPKCILDRIWSINTQPYALPATSQVQDGSMPIKGQVSLLTELEGRPLQVTPRNVAFSFRVRPRQRVYEVRDVPVRFLCPPGFPWRPRFAPDQPGRVTLRIQGPTAEEPPPVLAFVDLTGGNLSGGKNLEPVRVQLPREYHLAHETPLMAAFILEPVHPVRPGSSDSTDLNSAAESSVTGGSSALAGWRGATGSRRECLSAR
jgi:hypothetical protein